MAPHLRFGVAPILVPDGHTGPVYTYGDYKNIAIFGTSKHPAEAWQFVKYLVEAGNDLRLLEITNQIPVRGDLLKNQLFSKYFQTNPIMINFARQAMYTRSTYTGPDLKEILDAISQEYEACAVYAWITPEEAARDAMKRTTMIVDWNK